MQLIAVYITVLLIWSTTPLGIVWSAESVSPSLALLLRMSIALVLGAVIIKLFKIEFPWHKRAVYFYGVSTVGVAGGMFFTYLAAPTMPSGILSLIFGLAPLLSGVFAQKLLGEKPFSVSKKLALVLAFSGLVIVCYDKLFATQGELNIRLIDFLYVLCAVNLFSLSGVLIKKVELNINPVASTVGTLIVSMPIFLLSWLIFDGSGMPVDFEARSMWSIVYLGVFGSLLGFVGYFYILKRLSASTVSLVTLITPVMAIFLGNQLNNEAVTDSLMIGASLIILGLFLYFFGNKTIWMLALSPRK
ncbi:DMT family transporter [Paraglaciecola sp. 2405UD69-4]|uniref:DMT family transporter n=1 Tax=Paraglaciecola sp. 2405UD69-4 TaxID=3391836 RepID=UPI0039C9B78F